MSRSTSNEKSRTKETDASEAECRGQSKRTDITDVGSASDINTESKIVACIDNERRSIGEKSRSTWTREHCQCVLVRCVGCTRVRQANRGIRLLTRQERIICIQEIDLQIVIGLDINDHERRCGQVSKQRTCVQSDAGCARTGIRRNGNSECSGLLAVC